VNMAAKKEAYLSTSNGPLDFATAVNDVASMTGGLYSSDSLMKQQHHTALCLICLHKDKSCKYSIPKQVNPIIETILESGMKATGPMGLNRALASFTAKLQKAQ
jgi:hypothetical protein